MSSANHRVNSRMVLFQDKDTTNGQMAGEMGQWAWHEGGGCGVYATPPTSISWLAKGGGLDLLTWTNRSLTCYDSSFLIYVTHSGARHY